MSSRAHDQICAFENRVGRWSGVWLVPWTR